MSFDPSAPMIEAHGLGKRFSLYARPQDRLKELVLGRRGLAREFWALRGVDLRVMPGEVVGIVGRNGAGKSTLLQLICGTLQPSEGTLAVRGRVAALLELGAGFNPEFTGVENVFMNGALLGLSRREVSDRLDEILAFADIGEFVHQPVKTYSSGMYVRLAFAVATAVNPQILVIDEALAVGDGAFARKSFDRIMALKAGGATILFCSHSMYQVEALCSRALWLQGGRVRMAAQAADVTLAYGQSLEATTETDVSPGAQRPTPGARSGTGDGDWGGEKPQEPDVERLNTPLSSRLAPPAGSGRIVRISGRTGSQQGASLAVASGRSDVEIRVDYAVDPALPAPSVAFGICDAQGRTLCSASSHNDRVPLKADAFGHGHVVLRLPALPLLKGRYFVTCFLASEDGLHVYEQVERVIALDVRQVGLEQGVVSLPREWHA